MKELITETITKEVHTCDICGEKDIEDEHIGVRHCKMCNKELCHNCVVGHFHMDINGKISNGFGFCLECSNKLLDYIMESLAEAIDYLEE